MKFKNICWNDLAKRRMLTRNV